MSHAADLNAKLVLFDYLDLVSQKDALKVVVIQSAPDKTGRNEYIEFYNQIVQSKLDISVVFKLFHAVD
jgi:hypothetical protein